MTLFGCWSRADGYFTCSFESSLPAGFDSPSCSLCLLPFPSTVVEVINFCCFDIWSLLVCSFRLVVNDSIPCVYACQVSSLKFIIIPLSPLTRQHCCVLQALDIYFCLFGICSDRRNVLIRIVKFQIQFNLFSTECHPTYSRDYDSTDLNAGPSILFADLSQ